MHESSKGLKARVPTVDLQCEGFHNGGSEIQSLRLGGEGGNEGLTEEGKEITILEKESRGTRRSLLATEVIIINPLVTVDNYVLVLGLKNQGSH